MTVSSQVNKVTILGDGSTTVFSYNFLMPNASDAEVLFTDTDGTVTTLTSSQYSITGIGNRSGGTVTYPLVGSPIPVGSSLTIVRNLSLVQTTTISNQGPFAPAAIDNALDYLMMAIQQVNEVFERALVAPITDPSAPLPLPNAATRANQVLAFDENGQPTVAGVSSVPVSAAMQPVVAASTITVAKQQLGLGDMANEGFGSALQDDGSNKARVFFGIAVKGSDYVVAIEDHLTHIIATGPITVTLPRANTLFNSFGVTLSAAGGAITLAVDSHDAIYSQSSGASITLPQTYSAYVDTDAANAGTWYIQPTRANLPFASGTPQAGSSYSNLLIQNNSGTPDTRIDVSANEICLGGIGSQVLLSSFSTTINASNVGVNGIDTGALQANTWYYVWVIAGVTPTGTINSGAIVSISATAPTMPSGYTFKKRIGAFLTDASVRFYRIIQKNNKAKYVVGTRPTSLRAIATGASGSISLPTWTSFSVALLVPTPVASAINLMMSVVGVAVAMAAPSNSFGANNSTSNPPPMSIQTSSSSQVVNEMGEFILESANIYYAGSVSGGGNCGLYCVGWTDNI